MRTLEVENGTVLTAPCLALADDDGLEDLLTKLRLTLLDGGNDEIADGRSGETVEASLVSLDGNDVQVLGT